MEDRVFRALVRSCALDQVAVDLFNRMYDAHLTVPIHELIPETMPPGISDARKLVLGQFITFVRDNHWPVLVRSMRKFGVID